MIQLYRPVFKIPSPFQLAKRNAEGNSFNLITQGFGENLVDFYVKMGMKGHNGLDFMVAYVDCFAAHDGEVFKTLDSVNSSPTAGYGVYIRHIEGWWTLYFHMSSVDVKVGQKVKAGDFIGVTGNTGKYTVGPHLHFGLYPKDRDYNNGYDGAIDPLPYFSQEEIMGINPLNNTMQYVIVGKEQYLLHDNLKVAFNIGDELELGLLKDKGLSGNPIPMDNLDGYLIYPLINKERLQDLFGLV